MKGGPLRILVIPVTPLRQNCALAVCAATGRAALVDPGGEPERLLQVIATQAVTVERILLTHGHLDHAGAAAELSERLSAPIEGPHRDDAFLLESLPEAAPRYGMTGVRACTPDRWLEDGEEVGFGNMRLTAIHCPGHTPGHLVLYEKTTKFAFAGDVLFRGSIGRSDLPRGDYAALVTSIRAKLFPLGDDVRFLPGHGDMSTFGWERRTNPYVSDLAAQAVTPT